MGLRPLDGLDGAIHSTNEHFDREVFGKDHPATAAAITTWARRSDRGASLTAEMVQNAPSNPTRLLGPDNPLRA